MRFPSAPSSMPRAQYADELFAYYVEETAIKDNLKVTPIAASVASKVKAWGERASLNKKLKKLGINIDLNERDYQQLSLQGCKHMVKAVANSNLINPPPNSPQLMVDRNGPAQLPTFSVAKENERDIDLDLLDGKRRSSHNNKIR